MTMIAESDLYKDLQTILSTQIERVRKNDYRTIEKEIGNCNEIMQRINAGSTGANGRDNCEIEKIRKLYRKLTLMLLAAKTKMSAQLKHVKKNKNVLSCYKHSGGRKTARGRIKETVYG